MTLKADRSRFVDSFVAGWLAGGRGTEEAGRGAVITKGMGSRIRCLSAVHMYIIFGVPFDPHMVYIPNTLATTPLARALAPSLGWPALSHPTLLFSLAEAKHTLPRYMAGAPCSRAPPPPPTTHTDHP
jgi:hypothetical protein